MFNSKTTVMVSEYDADPSSITRMARRARRKDSKDWDAVCPVRLPVNSFHFHDFLLPERHIITTMHVQPRAFFGAIPAIIECGIRSRSL